MDKEKDRKERRLLFEIFGLEEELKAADACQAWLKSDDCSPYIAGMDESISEQLFIAGWLAHKNSLEG